MKKTFSELKLGDFVLVYRHKLRYSLEKVIKIEPVRDTKDAWYTMDSGHAYYVTGSSSWINSTGLLIIWADVPGAIRGAWTKIICEKFSDEEKVRVTQKLLELEEEYGRRKRENIQES